MHSAPPPQRAHAHNVNDPYFRAIVDRVAVGIAVVDEGGRIVEANPAFLEFLGYVLDEVIGQPSADFSPAADMVITREAVRALRAGEQSSVAVEKRFIRKDGSVRMAMLTLSCFDFGDGTVGFVGVIGDITVKRTLEKKLEQERAFLAAVLEHLHDGVVACDADGNLTLFNRALREMHGMGVQQIPPDEWASHYALYRADGVTPLPFEEIPLMRAFRGETLRDVPMVIAPRDGTARALLANGHHFTDDHGALLGAVVVMRDMTEQARAEVALRESETRHRALLDALPLAVYVVEPTFPYAPLYVSPGVASFGFTYDEWMSGPDSWTRALHPDDRERVLAETQAAFETCQPTEFEYRLVASDGSLRWVHDRGEFILGSDGKPMAWRGIMLDLTGRREAELALANERGFLAAVLDSLSEGIVACDRFGKVTLFNRATRKLHGLAAEGFIAPEQWGAHFNMYRPESHPQAGSPMPAHELPLIKALRARAAVHDVEFQLAPTGRAPRTMVANAHVIRGSNGEFLGAVSASRDMTEQKAVERALRESEARVRGAVQASLDAMFICQSIRDTAGGIIDFACLDVNARAAALVNLPEADMIGRPVSEMFPMLRTTGLLSSLCRVAETGEPFDREVQPQDERIVAQWVRLQAVRVGDGIGVTARDMTDKKTAEAKLRALALVDELTGVHNRRGFMALAEREWKRAEREKRGAVLAFIDLDNFKIVNDVHGHAEGDAVLKAVADVLRAAFRGADVIGRLGGDEFAVLVVPTGPVLSEKMEIFDVERRIIQRLHHHLASTNTVARQLGRQFDIGMSIGTAVVLRVGDPTSNATSVASLMVLADERLYQQKRGKEVATPVTPCDTRSEPPPDDRPPRKFQNH